MKRCEVCHERPVDVEHMDLCRRCYRNWLRVSNDVRDIEWAARAARRFERARQRRKG